MQHTATHCNTLQHTATHCNTLQHTASAVDGCGWENLCLQGVNALIHVCVRDHQVVAQHSTATWLHVHAV